MNNRMKTLAVAAIVSISILLAGLAQAAPASQGPIAPTASRTVVAHPLVPLDNTHCLTPRNCVSALYTKKESAAVKKCLHTAAKAAAAGAVGTAVLTTPIDIPGIEFAASFTWLSALAYCFVGF